MSTRAIVPLILNSKNGKVTWLCPHCSPQEDESTWVTGKPFDAEDRLIEVILDYTLHSLKGHHGKETTKQTPEEEL